MNFFKNFSVYIKIFLWPFLTTRESIIPFIQYRSIHCVLHCHKWIYDIKLKLSDTYNYFEGVDDIQHLICHCDKSNAFWVHLFNW